MRGKDFTAFILCNSTGITPAHAGKSTNQVTHGETRGDHPRTCGEKTCICTASINSSGSPPHMRGKVQWVALSVVASWITPAHAGKRIIASFPQVDIGDHPRTCGEKSKLTTPTLEVLGSPPHMRGKAVRAAGQVCAGGITPAHAGKRWRRPHDWTCGRDHPRTCGEKDHPA